MQPKIRYTDTSYIVFQQWEKGREKTAFPIVFNYEYNRQKFANLDRADQRSMSLSATASPTAQLRQAPPPPPPPLPITNNSASYDRKLRKRKSRSLERRRQPKTIELSDSDEEIRLQQSSHQPVILSIDEVDRGVPASTVATTATNDAEIISVDEIQNDSLASAAKSPQTPQTNPLRIDESSTSVSGNECQTQQNVIVDVHEPDDIVLEIREECDDPARRRSTSLSSLRNALTKDTDLYDVPENDAENELRIDDEKCSAAADASETETMTPSPLPVPKCDINDNALTVELSVNNDDDDSSIVEVDINHNDVTTPVAKRPHDSVDMRENRNSVLDIKGFVQRRISESSRSSFDESDGVDTEPNYARVESLRNRVSFDLF